MAQQFRWHTSVDSALDWLRSQNAGTTADGKTFGEVASHFVLGGDETCFLASAGDVSIIGDKGKKKHEVTTADSRTSITVYRTGSAAGATGPTGFLPPGTQTKTGYTDQFLVAHGAKHGSTIVMTDTGYMTEDAWLRMAPFMVAGIRAMPVICDRPDWWVLKIIDGFGAHTSSLAAMEVYADAKVLLLKEEGDTSHVCQAYDQMVAKDDKRSMRACLGYLRQHHKVTKGVVDGWGLIHVALAACRELNPDSWVKSFERVNLNPHTRVPFDAWCVRIADFLVGGESFKVQSLLDPYSLLPSWWHGMPPAEKHQAYGIFTTHEKAWTVACVKEARDVLHIPLKDMQHLRVCLELAGTDPAQLDRGVIEGAAHEGPALPPAVVSAQASMPAASKGLQIFQLHPQKPDGTQLLTGEHKFKHLIAMARRSTPLASVLTPSVYLDIAMGPEQQALLDPTAQDFAMGTIMAHAHGAGAKVNMAKRKLDSLGNLRGASGLANDDQRKQRLMNQLNLAKSLAAISKETQSEAAQAKSMATTASLSLAPAAIQKLKEKGGLASCLTMAELKAVAFASFNGSTLKGDKAAHVRDFNKLVAAQPSILNLHLQDPAVPADMLLLTDHTPSTLLVHAQVHCPPICTLPLLLPPTFCSRPLLLILFPPPHLFPVPIPTHPHPHPNLPTIPKCRPSPPYDASKRPRLATSDPLTTDHQRQSPRRRCPRSHTRSSPSDASPSNSQ